MYITSDFNFMFAFLTSSTHWDLTNTVGILRSCLKMLSS